MGVQRDTVSRFLFGGVGLRFFRVPGVGRQSSLTRDPSARRGQGARTPLQAPPPRPDGTAHARVSQQALGIEINRN
jgi:hypothetical protein